MNGCPACEAMKGEWNKLVASKLIPTTSHEVRTEPQSEWPPSDGPIQTVPTVVLNKNGRVIRYHGPRTADAMLKFAYES